MTQDITTFRFLIGGQLIDGDMQMDVVNPARGSPFQICPRASKAQLDMAVAAADAAFGNWSSAAHSVRKMVLKDIAARLELHAHELATLLTQEQGKPLPDALEEVQASAGFFRQFADVELQSERYAARDDRAIEGHRRPLGVVAAIVPWNFPLVLMAMKVPAALIAGNTVVLKPAATTPLTMLRFGALIRDIVPPGVLNIIADANDLGADLVAHPRVRKISFTGSTETGRKVMASSAHNLARLTLELGGNDAAIVLSDVDPREVAPKIFKAAFRNAGQVCMAIKRLYVHEDIYDEVCSALELLASKTVMGDGLTPGVEIGPVQNEVQYQKVRALIENAKAAGGIVSGVDDLARAGYFVRPTIIRNLGEGTRIVDEEQFGPALPVIKFADPEDALRQANNSPYGLGGSVWSSNEDAAVALAKRLDVGTAWVNTHLEIDFSTPFGGAKQSGMGCELGQNALAEYTQLHIINIATAS